jgi:hypothetical protein
VALSVLAVVLTLAAGAQSLWLSHRAAALAARWRRAVLLNVDRQLALERAQTAAETQQVAEAVVHGTTATVQAVHRGIAAIPFGILEAIPVTRAPARLVRAVHDLTANSVYGAITGLNKLIGRGLRRGKPKS